jgi:phosphoribosylformylglycinamidine synthase
LLERLKNDFKLDGIEKIRRVDVYSFEEDLADEDAKKLALELLSDPVISNYSIGKPLYSDFSFGIEVGFKPGVKDNVGETAQSAAADVLGRQLKGRVFTSTLYLFYGDFPKEKAKEVAEGVLCNPLIQRWKSIIPQEIAAYYSSIDLPLAGEASKGMVLEIPLLDDDSELEKISKKRMLALNISEMRAIFDYFSQEHVRKKREALGLSIYPTDVELECIAQTWSEHCKHKIFNATIDYIDASNKLKGSKKSKKKKSKQNLQKIARIRSLFKTYIKSTTESISSSKHYLLSVFTDNAGIMALDENWALAVKVETHNTPSALDPYGGALTGILGVNRDVLGAGLGAKPIFNTDIFCFASPFYSGPLPPRLLHPKRVFEGVRAGVERGGNASGIPTINGSIYFDDRYLGKPLVYCGTGGLLPREILGRSASKKYHKPGDRIFMVGGRIGKDGIHGATFSSQELHEGSPTSAVQLGDPFTQKCMLDFLLDARDKGLYSALTDNGAGGLSSSVGEMAKDTGGAIIHLERCPLKYPGLDPWEIFLSESQERMTVAVPPQKAGDFAALAAQWGVEATDIGEFTSSGYLQVFYYGNLVALLELGFLHNGLPKMHLQARWNPPAGLKEPEILMPSDLKAELLELLSRPNICSKESVIRQYDHEVQGMSVIKPLCGRSASGPSDAAVLQPFASKPWGIVVSHGICPRFSDIDPYYMAMLAVDEAARNYIAAGGDPHHWGGLDNFCWPDPIPSASNPDGEQKLAALVRTCQGLSKACKAYRLPLISGKDSMKNDYKYGQIKISIPPTLLVSIVGKIPDVSLAISSDFKEAGDIIYVLGETKDELGGSEYYAKRGIVGANVPKPDLKSSYALYSRLHSAILQRLVASAHDCSDGGLAVALAECCIGGRLGAYIKLANVPREDGLQDDKILFSESAGRFVVSVHPKNAAKFESLLSGCTFARIGEVITNQELHIEGSKPGVRLSASIAELESAFKQTITW